MTSPNDLITEFQKLKLETNKINENFLDTTSTFGCSSESILLRKVLDELKSMNSKMVKFEEKQRKTESMQQKTQKRMLDELKAIKSKVVEIEEEQEHFESIFALKTQKVLQKTVLNELQFIKEKQTELQNVVVGDQMTQKAYYEALAELKIKQETLQDVFKNKMLDELKAIKSDMVIIKEEIKTNAPGMESVAEEPIINQNNVPEMHPDDEKPILEAIVGKWKLVDQDNCEAYFQRFGKFEGFFNDITVSVNSQRILSDYKAYRTIWPLPLAIWKDEKITMIDENVLKLWERSGSSIIKTHNFIENGQLHKLLSNRGVTCLRIYDRIRN